MFMVMAWSESGGASQQENKGGQLMAKQIEKRDLSLWKLRSHLFVYFQSTSAKTNQAKEKDFCLFAGKESSMSSFDFLKSTITFNGNVEKNLLCQESNSRPGLVFIKHGRS